MESWTYKAERNLFLIDWRWKKLWLPPSNLSLALQQILPTEILNEPFHLRLAEWEKSEEAQFNVDRIVVSPHR